MDNYIQLDIFGFSSTTLKQSLLVVGFTLAPGSWVLGLTSDNTLLLFFLISLWTSSGFC